MTTIESWPGSIADQEMLIKAIGKFLRTHQKGGRRLMELLATVPPDRTEKEYRELREQAEAKHEAAIQSKLKEVNAIRRAKGQPQIDWKGNVISTRAKKRNAP